MAHVVKTISAALESNARYAVRIRSINSLGVPSAYSEALDFITDDDSTIPPPPTNVTASPGLRTIVLKWDPVDISDFSHYEIYVKQTSGDYTPIAQELIARPDGNNTQILSRYWNGSTYTDLVPGTTYTIKMRAVDIAGNVGTYSLFVPVTVGFLLDTDISGINPNKIVSGTFSNTYTFSGAVILSGAQAFSGIATITGSFLFSGAGVIETASVGSRATVSADGVQMYGTGGATVLFDFDPSTGSIVFRTEGLTTRRVEIATTTSDSIQFYPDGVGVAPHLISTSSDTNFVGVHKDIVLRSFAAGTSNAEGAITVGNYSALANPVGWINLKGERQISTLAHVTSEMIMGWGSIYYTNDESPFASGTLMPFTGFTAEYFSKDPSGITPPTVIPELGGYPLHSYFIQAGSIVITTSSGSGDLVLPRNFPNGILTVVASNADPNNAKAKYSVQIDSDARATSKSIVNIRIYDTATNADATNGTTLRVGFIAIGW